MFCWAALTQDKQAVCLPEGSATSAAEGGGWCWEERQTGSWQPHACACWGLGCGDVCAIPYGGVTWRPSRFSLLLKAGVIAHGPPGTQAWMMVLVQGAPSRCCCFVKEPQAPPFKGNRAECDAPRRRPPQDAHRPEALPWVQKSHLVGKRKLNYQRMERLSEHMALGSAKIQGQCIPLLCVLLLIFT